MRGTADAAPDRHSLTPPDAGLRIVFAGTPEFACPLLQALIDSGRCPAAVLTQPDRPAGRGRTVTASPVKRLARQHGIELFQPATLKTPDSAAQLSRWQPDLLVTAAYGLILPQAVLDVPRLGCWNLHASLLPRWRGASPIQQAILHGDTETGVSLMQMAAGLDSGPVILSERITIDETANAAQLHDQLSLLAARVLLNGLHRLESGTLPAAQPQQAHCVTYAPRIEKRDAWLDWTRPAAQLAAMVRAYNPWPVAHGELNGLPVRVYTAQSAGLHEDVPAGSIVKSAGDAIRVACGEGALDILELQSPGKRRLPAREWLHAHPDWR